MDKLIKFAELFATAVLQYTPSIPGYKRMTTASQEVQQKAMQILQQVRNQPWGTKIPFTADNGIQYMAVLEEHYGGSVPGSHPGISVFIKNNQNLNQKDELDELIEQFLS